MKKIFICLLISFLVPASMMSQSTRTVGTNGADYPTLFDAFFDINNGLLTGTIVLQIIDNVTESSTAELFQDGYSGTASYNSVVIYPVSAGLTISGDIDGALISLNGATNVTIDGRVNRSGNRDLVITNTNTGASASTIQFSESASGNRIEYCIIKGSGTGTSSGVIFYSTATTGNGNDGNTLDNNDITSDAAGRPVNVIFSSGTAGSENSGNTISNNNFYNFLRHSAASNGILLSSNTTLFTITGNSFYETSSFAPTGSVAYNIIRIDNPSGTGFNINGNFIGGQLSLCGGSAWTKTAAFNNAFNAVNINAGTGSPTDIQNNTIQNIAWSNSSNAAWTGINIAAGSVNIGTTTGNVIGDPSGTGSVTVTAGATNANVYGINIAATGSIQCENNIIGGITAANSNSNFATNLYGINKTATAGPVTISQNTIGSSTVPNSFSSISASLSNAQSVFGISNAGTDNITISDNIISNLSNGTTNTTAATAGVINGIRSTNGANLISYNTIGNLTNSNANTSSSNTASVTGIALTGSSLKTLIANEIYSLKNTYSSFAGTITGIYFTGNTGANEVKGNFIHSLSATGASSNSSTIYGIQIASGAATFANNIVALGSTTQMMIYGIYETGAAGNNNNIYFNTVYIGGSPAAGSGNSYALYSAVTTNVRNFRNNVFFNARSNSGATGSHYAVYIVSSGGSLTIDYNDYYTSGTGGILGYLAGDVVTLAAWKTATGQDANSLSVDPVLVNAGGTTASDYSPGVVLPGVTGTGIITDYNGAVRGVTPTMGAFEGGSCTNPINGGTITSSQTGCNPFDPAAFISTAPASGYTGVSLEYKWQQSTTGSSSGFSDIPGTNSPTYNPGSLAQTTWFKRLARVTCIGDWTGAAETNVLTVTVNPLPNTGLAVGGAGSICAGSGTNITVALSETGVNYQLRNGTVNVGSPAAGTGGTLSFPTGNLTSTTIFNILATNATTGCSAQLSQTATVTISSLPDKNLAVGGGGPGVFVCYGTGKNITVSLSETGVNYQLRNGVAPVGTPVAGNGGTINLPTGSMTFNITYNVLATNASSGCNAQLTQTAIVSVWDLPQGGLTANGPFCGSGTGQLTWTATAGTGPFTIVYNDGTANRTENNVISGTPFNVFTNPVVGTTTYTLVSVTDANGCIRNSGFTGGSAVITVRALPQGSLTANGPLCGSGTGQLTWTATAGTGPFTVVYNDGTADRTANNITSGTAFNVFTNPVVSTTTYTLVSVTDANGCIRNSGFTGGSAVITVSALPQGSLTANGPLCGSGTGQLTWTATAGTGPFTVVYNDGTANRTENNVTSGTPFNVFTNPVVSTTTYALVSVADANGCVRNSGFTAGSAIITVNPLPQGSLAANGPFCLSGTGQLTLTATSGTGPFTVVYNDGTANRTVNNVTSGTPFNAFTNPVVSTTTYTLFSVTDANGCIRNSGFTGSSAVITINPLPQGSLTANGSFCGSGTGQLTWTATSGTGPFTVIYNDGTADRTANNVTTGTAFNVFTNPVVSTTTYTLVSVTDAGGCVRSSGFTTGSAVITVDPSSNGGTLSGGAGTIVFGNSTGVMTLSGYTGSVINWQKMLNTGAWQDITNTNPTYGENPSSTGTWSYRVQVKSGACPAAFSTTLNIVVSKASQVITFTDIPEKLLVNDAYTLGAVATSGLTVLFESLDIQFATISGNILTGVAKGTARIRAYNQGDSNYNPAETINTVEIYSTHKNILYLFTPNGDGINDYWELPDMAVWGKCDVKVYNRWGKLVFEDPNYNNLWNGTSNSAQLPEGPYYFIIKTENAGMVKGTVNIVR